MDSNVASPMHHNAGTRGTELASLGETDPHRDDTLDAIFSEVDLPRDSTTVTTGKQSRHDPRPDGERLDEVEVRISDTGTIYPERIEQPDSSSSDLVAVRAALLKYRSLCACHSPAWWSWCWSRCNKEGWQTGASCSSISGLWYLFIRLIMFVSILAGGFQLGISCREQDWTEVAVLNMPFLLGIVAAYAAIWSQVPRKFDEAIAEASTGSSRNPAVPCLNLKDVEAAGRVSNWFMLFWIGGITCSNAALFLTLQKTQTVGQLIIFFVISLAFSSSTIPCLGAIIFTFSLDICRWRKLISTLVTAAQDRSLTIDMYRRTHGIVFEAAAGWKRSLFTLSFVSAWSLLGAILFASTYSDYGYLPLGEQLIHDFYAASILAKEGTLLFILTYLVKFVNDEADGIVVDVCQWHQREETRSAPEPMVHSDEISELGQLRDEIRDWLSDVKGEQLRLRRELEKEKEKNMLIVEGSVLRLVSGSTGPIGVTVLGVRWTSGTFKALIISTVVSGLTSVLQALVCPDC